MSTRCDGVARRSFIIGSRLWPPAMTRASGPRRSRAAIAPSTLVARSYSNGAGVCTGASPLSSRGSSTALGEPLPGCADVVALLVLLGRVGADDRGPLEVLGPVLTDLGRELSGVEAPVLDRPETRPARRARGRDRGLAAEARQR